MPRRAGSPRVPRRARHIAALAYPGAEVLDITGPLEVFDAASRLEARDSDHPLPLYETSLIARSKRSVEVTAHLQLTPQHDFGSAANLAIDTLIVPGGLDVSQAFDPKTLGWLRATANRVERLVGVCSGALILAEAGLLNGRRATTHWESCDRLARYAGVRVQPDSIFVQDGEVYTSAGITAGMDLALSLVETDWGPSLALATARELVMYARRTGGQSQFSPHLRAHDTGSPEFGALVEWALGRLHEDLPVSRLAERCSMSVRNFSRAFVREIGMTPARFIEAARLEAARALLERGDTSLDAVAAQCGFRRAETMRRSFQRRIGVLPADYRRHFKLRRSR